MGNKGLFLGFIIVITSIQLPLPTLAQSQISQNQLPKSNCGYSQVQIQNATPIELQRTCEVINVVAKLFEPVGIKLDPKVTYVFQDKVEVKIDGEVYSPYGYYDTDSHIIPMVHFISGKDQGRTSWDEDWNEDLAVSFLIHETTHMYVIGFMGDSFKNIPHVWHESVAYYVQFETMEPSLRAKILKNMSMDAFEDPSLVSEDIYEMNPEVFA
jgi:hypothetical protein